MRPDHLPGPAGRIPRNIGSPIIGRFASTGSGFLLSVSGFPLVGSILSFSHTTVPQSPSPHRLTRIRASPACVNHTPVGSSPTGAAVAADPHDAQNCDRAAEPNNPAEAEAAA